RQKAPPVMLSVSRPSNMTKKSLKITHPAIVQEWNSEKTGDLSPEDVTATSRQKVWWYCSQRHEYQVSIHSRVRSNGCKICQQLVHVEKTRLTKLKKSRSFAAAQPQLIPEWDCRKNAPITPHDISHKSHKLIWWKCTEGHSWQSTPQRRSRGDGCPECYEKNRGEIIRSARLKKAGISFAEAYPELLNEWYYERNERLPDQLAPKSNYRATWRCQYGHIWETTITNRTNNHSNCPECNPQSSRIEIYLLCEIRTIFPETEWRRLIDGVECDIYISEIKLGIEVDGGYWHDNKLQKDINKTHYFNDRDINLVRVRDNTLPAIEGNQIDFNRIGSLQDVANHLMSYLAQFNIAFANYPNKQQAESEFKEMIARLPAPPDGETLVDTHPDIATQWDYDKNTPLVPDLFSKGSNQKFWWLCEKGHSYDAAINNRVSRESGCPVCYRENASDIARQGRLKNTQSLTQDKPVYLAMFDLNKNSLPPSEIAVKSNIDIWWKCKHGHSFLKKAVYMAGNHECPTCNTLVFKFPDIATQWHPIKNQAVDIRIIHAGSGQKVWWKCKKGHEWKTAVNMRTGEETNCPHCYNENRGEIYRQKAAEMNGSLADLNPDFLAQWDKEKNGDLTPDKMTAKSRTKVWWKCEHGHSSYEQAIASKARGSICPECAKSKRAESVRLARLKNNGSLKDRYPNIAEHWDNAKNGDLKPELVTIGSKKIIYWKCNQGHHWHVSVNTMTDKRRYYICPECKNKKQNTGLVA
ncbi:MAG: hypothetical protein DRR42_23580, partial [Gammaproteobacteria bacterium]